uniref:Uncharacterized protein n=1 Tax=Anguilla anguilla TaxID=7936 RepID=A0A0E9PKZ8_ANGAN
MVWACMAATDTDSLVFIDDATVDILQPLELIDINLHVRLSILLQNFGKQGRTCIPCIENFRCIISICCIILEHWEV